MQVLRNKVLANLQKKGFKRVERKRHTQLTYYNKEGKKPGFSTLVSRGTKYRELGTTLVATMAHQCGLKTPQEFLQLVNCSMSQDDYDDLLRCERGDALSNS